MTQDECKKRLDARLSRYSLAKVSSTVVFLCFFLTALISNAQDEKSSLNQKRIDFVLGPSLLYPTGSWPKEDKSRRPMFGYTLGIGYQHLELKRFHLATRLLFERKGYATFDSNTDTDGNVSEVYTKQKFNYFTISILPSYTFGARQRAKIIFGPYISLLIHDAYKQEVFLNGQFSFSFFTSNVKGRFERFDYGISAGIGHSFPINDRIGIDLQLLGNLGLYNIVPSDFPGVVIRPASISLLICLSRNP